MALTKTPITINFQQGVDKKTDPNQVALGKFLALQNMVFDRGGLLQKRNGYRPLTALPDSSSNYVTTFSNDLVAIGSSLLTYASGSQTWIEQADMTPVSLDVVSMVKSNTSQTQSESVVAPNGSVCVAYTDQTSSSLTTPIHKYIVADSVTGANIVEPTTIASDSTYGTPRVFLLPNYFIIVYISSTGNLDYIAITIANPLVIKAPVHLSLSITPSTHGLAFDGAVSSINNTIYFAWNGASSSGLKMCTLTSNLVVSSTINPDAAHLGDIVTVTVDQSFGTVWVMYYGYVANTTYALARSTQMAEIHAPFLIIPSLATHISNLTGAAVNRTLTFCYEVVNAYGYDSGIYSNFILKNTFTEAGVLGTETFVSRSVGLASKIFSMDSVNYVVTLYYSPYQPTYFIMDLSGNIIARFAYQNGPGYYVLGLGNVTVNGSVASLSYLVKDLVQAVNKNTNVPSGNQTAGVYAQTGINLINLSFGQDTVSAEIGHNLNLTGGMTLAYDGFTLTEQNFFLYPDSIKAVWADTGGSMSAYADPNNHSNDKQYFYQVCYEWSDNQGNIIRSAPSIPVFVDTTGSGVIGSVAISVPTLRLSLKLITGNPIKIVVYRWSVGQQVYYQTTSITLPKINTPAVDYIVVTDTNADITILGNNILYTTGGVIENISPPAFDSVFLFDTRLWGIESEDKNNLWFSKPVLANTPVEMSDLFTLYVAPTIGAQGSTGDLRCGAVLDSNLILFKKTAINYINGEGPDITGSNSGYSQPLFITSTVGCSNQKSIVFQPQGLMFEFAAESGNQIWLLARNFQTSYIGAPVQEYTQSASVLSALSVPGTTQVRFTLSSGITVVYDYYYEQWFTFKNVPAVSSTIYNGLHTYINSLGQVFQESPSLYLDGSNPVLMSFTTSWIQLAGLQGYQRAYYFFLLATYVSPHLLNLSIAYDYNPAAVQQSTIYPDNYNPNFGIGYNYGIESPFGGNSNIEQWQVNLTQQRCESFQISLSEIYDPSLGVAAGAGFTMSGMTVIVGVKKGFYPKHYSRQVGGGI